MNQFFKNIILLVLVILFSLTSCQDEVLEIDDISEQEAIVANSELSSLMTRTSSNTCDEDNFIDNSNCFSVELPVTIIINNTTIIIEDTIDLQEVENLIETLDNEDINFIFPITIIFNDYTEVVIENEEQLFDFIEDCELEDDNSIDCIDFEYPISFSVFNTEFDVLETVSIEDDTALYEFLSNLENNNSIISLNYPVTLINSIGDTISVNSNEELIEAIENAEDECYDDNENLFECFESFDAYIELCDENNDGFEMFNLNYAFANCLPDADEVTYHSTLEDANTSANPITNPEQFTNTTANQIVYIRVQIDNQIEIYPIELIVEDCEEENPFECFESFDAYIELCDENNDGYEVFNLNNAFVNCLPDADEITYHETVQDADNSVNPIANSEQFTNTSVNQAIYIRVQIDNEIRIYPIQLILEDCSNNDCSEDFIYNNLIECTWNITNYNGSDNLDSYDLNFDFNDIMVIASDNTTPFTAIWTISDTSTGVYLEFSNIALPNIQAINGSWVVTECGDGVFELHNNANDIMVLHQSCN